MEDYAPLSEGQEAHWEVSVTNIQSAKRNNALQCLVSSKVVERLLFLYAKLNPGQGYVQVILFFGGFHAVTSVQQGMNEIIGPIYYVMASDPRQVKNLYDNCDAAALQGLIIKWKIVLNDIKCS